MIFDLTVNVGSIYILIEKRQPVRNFIRITVPEVNNVIAFSNRIMLDIIAADILDGGFSICWDEGAAAGLVKLQPVEWALNTIALDLTTAKRRTPVRTLVNNAAKFTFIGPEQRKLQIQSFHADNLILFNSL